MPIDTSMYAGARGIDLGDAIEKGMSIRDMMDTRAQKQKALAEQEQVKNAYRAGNITGSDGAVTFDPNRTVSEIAKFNPQLAQEHQQQFDQRRAQRAEAGIKQAVAGAQIASSIDSPESFATGIAHAESLGIPVDHLKKMSYEEFKAVRPTIIAEGQSAKEKLDQTNKDREFTQKDRELGLKHEETGVKRAEINANRQDNFERTAALNLGNHLDKGWTSRAGQAGKAQEIYNTAERAEQLLAQAKEQPGGLDERQARELATITNKVLGGSEAVSQIDHLLPHTWYGRAKSLEEAMTNTPVSAGLEAFTERLGDTIKREKAVALEQKRRFQIEGLTAHAGLKQKNPALYESILRSHGIDPEMIDERGQYRAGGSGGGGGNTEYENMHTDELTKAYNEAQEKAKQARK